jgi:2-oxo-3-hexenedioate decarboxylase/2-keto-4-pentenoate hydratase
MADEDRIAGAARRLFEAHRDGLAMAPLPEHERPRDIAEAYLAQDRLLDLYAGAGHQVGGWKVALTTPVMQQMVGIDRPCEGAIFTDRIHEGTVEVRGADFRTLGVESEIAMRLDRDLAAAGAPYDRDTVAAAVGTCMAGIEICDLRDVVYDQLDAPLLIADNSMNQGCVLGPPVVDWRALDLGAAAGRMVINGAMVGEGHGRDALGHPLLALAWLANNLVERGRHLRAGDVVMTGSIVTTKLMSAGDEMVTTIDGLGDARLVVV